MRLGKRCFAGALSFSIIAIALFVAISSALAQPFTSLEPGFTQELFSAARGGFGGVAFAPNRDPWAAQGPNTTFPLTPSLLFRFSLASTIVVNSTAVHPQVAESPFASVNGTGVVNGSDGNLYSNTLSGVVRLDPNTGSLLAGPFGPLGQGLGVANDPETGNLVYVGRSSILRFVDPAFSTTGTFSTATAGRGLDGIFFDRFCSLLSAFPRPASVLSTDGQYRPVHSESSSRCSRKLFRWHRRCSLSHSAGLRCI